ncbi:MAG: winged helix-turn-helix domain-containing protein [Cyclobacteriaceae bacterium]
MSVNSALKGFFNNGLMLRPSIAIVMLAIFFIESSFKKRSDRDLLAKQTNLIVRQIGHQLLLQAGDPTSRVLPVTEIKKGTFLLKFENEFVFSHDSLMMLTQRLLPKEQFHSGYTVTVHECLNASIVFGYQINNTTPNILACKGRSQPAGCYTIEIVLPDLYENVELKKADIDQLIEERKSIKADPQQVNSKFEELESIKVDHKEANPKPEERKSFNIDSQEGNQKLEEFKTTIFGYPLPNLVYIAMLVLLGVTFLIGRFRKRLVPALLQNQDHTILKEPVEELPTLGKFLFDVKDQRLLLGSEVISLTDKEYRVLELLNQNFGELIPRETLMQKIWIDEGVITGRSLDMFVSKLRKKLSTDPELRITNVHGKGYKLEVAEI